MGKTKHTKIALRVPSNQVVGKTRKEYQDHERPKNSPNGRFFKYGVSGVIREEQVDGHKSNGKIKKIYNRILRKKINVETDKIVDDSLFPDIY